MTSALIATAMETVLNCYLRLDPQALSRLAELDGAVIAIEPEGLDLTLFLFPNAHGIKITDTHEGEPTVWIRGTPVALAQQWRGVPASATDLTVEGNATIGWEFQTILTRIDIDWEELLSQLIGDPAAYQLGHHWRRFLGWSARTGDILLHNGGEYLQQELRVLPPRYIVERFLGEVDKLREDTDRLTARIKRLQGQLAPNHPV